MRSRAAAAVLLGAGFKQVYSMEGGMKAWQGLVADVSPETGITYFLSAGDSPEKMLALAWSMEEGTRRVYQAVAQSARDERLARIYAGLVAAEIQHKKSLEDIHARLFPGVPAPAVLLEGTGLLGNMAESGRSVEDLIEEATIGAPEEVLAFSLALETNSLDLYLKMIDVATESEAREIFTLLAGEEQAHLDRLGKAIDDFMASPD